MLKKCLFYYIIFCLLIISFVFVPDKKLIFADIVKNYSNVDYTFYCANSSNVEKLEFCNIVNVGYGLIISTDFCNAKNTKKKLSNIQGESITIEGFSKSECFDIMKNFSANIIREEKIENVLIIYTFSPILENYVIDNGEKINLQFAITNEKLTVGYPLIMGSY